MSKSYSYHKFNKIAILVCCLKLYSYKIVCEKRQPYLKVKNNTLVGNTCKYTTMALFNLPTLLILILLLLPLVLFFIKKQKKQDHHHLPPGPPKLPIIGNLHQLGELPHQSLHKLAKIHGPVMLLQLGHVPTVIVSSAEAAKVVLKTHDIDCCSRPPLLCSGRLTYNSCDIAFSPYSDYWREIRKVAVLELFSIKRVQQFHPVRVQEIESMINSISQSAAASTPVVVDLTEKLFGLMASITFKVAFGRSFKGSKLDNNRFQEVVHDTSAMMGCFAVSDFFPFYAGLIVDKLSGLCGRLERTFHELDGFYQQVLDEHTSPERIKSEDDHEDIIDVMLKIESSSSWFTKTHIKGILLNIFLGGVDTGAITMAWTMSELIRNPRIMKKVQDEVRSCVGNKGKVEEGDIGQLHYFKMVLKETMRLHPAAPLLVPREAMNHFKILGYDIHPKTRIQVNAWAISRDPEIWKNPEEFNPERFTDSSIDYKGQHFELLPFGGGRRICPGINMAMSIVELALANLLYCFDWKLPDGIKKEDISMEEGPGLTVGKTQPLKLVPINKHYGMG